MNMATENTTQEKGAVARVEPTFPTSPFAMMRRLSDDMEQMFEETWGPRRLPRFFRGFELGESHWLPDIEMFERKGEFVVRADLPGLTRDDVKVEIGDNELVIQGERKEEKEQKEKGGYYACEHSYGSFYRSISLPEGVKGDEAKAAFKDGVLEITMPVKTPEKHGRRLEIKTA